MTIRYLAGTFVCMCLAALSMTASAEEPTLILKRPLITMDAAEKVAHETIGACRKQGVNVTVTVIDRSGRIISVLRDTLAMDITLDLSRLKAVTALSMNSVTGTLTGRYKNPGALEMYDGLLFMPGGVPINAGGAILGAVGVSGAPDAKVDELCAQAGVRAIAAELEMAM